jgi:transcriptional regulator with XRE-family HTH domain
MGSIAKEIGQRIRQARDKRKLTIDQLADRIGFTVRSLGAWERGEAPKGPSAVAIHAIAKVLEVSADYLLWLENPADSLRVRAGSFHFVDLATFKAVSKARREEHLPFDKDGDLVWAHVIPETWHLVEQERYARLRTVVEGKKAELCGRRAKPRPRA